MIDVIAPNTTLIKYIKAIIRPTSLVFLFTLYNINRPRPELLKRPVIMVDKDIALSAYNCDNKTDGQQLGIKPTRPAINPPYTGILVKAFFTLS